VETEPVVVMMVVDLLTLAAAVEAGVLAVVATA
jgi:hypothetical protein